MMECQMFGRIQIAASVFVAWFAFCVDAGFAQTTILANADRATVVRSRIEPGMLNENGEEIVGRASGFSAVMTLDDASLKTLLRDGRVEIEVPTPLINSVESVIIKRPFYFKDKHASDFADAKLAGHRLVLNVDDSVVERIDYQPVELKVYETGFTSVVLNYVGKTSSLTDRKIGDADADSPLLTVKLKSGKGITGRIKGMKSLKMDSTLGRITVSFARTSKIFVRDNGELNIEMANGDLISGTIDGGQIELINRWGSETIDMSDVAALLVRQSNK
ncbi:hypothetical protein [Mariniblastus fucicola]|uniref:Uncharacterized protein n=1 Tax=Mariniblastus fucicola TaxID=980251 RepID=A0A5B9P3Y7_9BACT|nr:hypothetical protein [Mariniblastus fucicola]QEG21118.1 hypothetical protein MFFC18_09720 [Mariniblastus fucicola]